MDIRVYDYRDDVESLEQMYRKLSKDRADLAYSHVGSGVYKIYDSDMIFYESLDLNALEEVRRSLLIMST